MTPRRFARLTSILDRRQTTLTVLLDDLQKAHNVSAVMRTCDAVGVGWIHALSTEDSFRAKTTSAAGSEHYVETELHRDAQTAVDALRGRGFRLYAAHLDDRAIDFRSVDFTRPTCLVMGQEGPGVSAELLDRVDGTIAIPMVGAVASLNVSVATAVILYEAQRQRQLAGLYDTPHVDPETRHRRLFEWGYRDIARFCRERGYAYPELGDAGEIIGEVPRG
ncbi:MAG: tRNA (guanosine(18)-2'-O)-methyltransferase TrmH [Acidobacteriota bacterium]